MTARIVGKVAQKKKVTVYITIRASEKLRRAAYLSHRPKSEIVDYLLLSMANPFPNWGGK